MSDGPAVTRAELEQVLGESAFAGIYNFKLESFAVANALWLSRSTIRSSGPAGLWRARF